MESRLDALKEMNLKELYALAKELKIPRFNRFNKKDLILEILKAESKKKKKDFAGGILEILQEGYGFLRTNTYLLDQSDIYVSPSQIRKFGLRTGDLIIGQIRPPRDGEGYKALLKIEAVNFDSPEKIKNRDHFHKLTPLYPTERIQLEIEDHSKAPDLDANALHSLRIVDLITPIGKGQRGLIVSPPKAGKTTLIKQIANAVTVNHPDIELMVLLIDERPEEVTDMERSVQGEVISSTFDMPISNHIQVTEMVLEKAKRLVEQGKDVMILLDSITRLARAYNINTPASGQTLSGGVNPQALYKPKKFFGSARNLEEGGSLTILATALIETGSRMDEVIFEEFKGTGNMELVLDRKLFEKRIFPSIDLQRSSTRKEELLLDEIICHRMTMIRRLFEDMTPQSILELILEKMRSTDNNKEFIKAITARKG